MESIKGQLKQIVTNQKLFKNIVLHLVKSVTNIEDKVEDIKTQSNMKLFDQQDEFEKLMKENNNEIKAINDKIDMLKVKEKAVENISSNLNICSFFNKGYCSSKEICPFYLPKEICEIYLSKGVCRKLVCKYRHLKDCRYWKRNKSCY